MLKNLLVDYVNDSNNAELSYQIGIVYQEMKQYASASTFFIRASELTDNLDIRYNSVLNLALCLKNQNNRRFSYKNMILRSITIDYKRPEAYYLLAEWYETDSNEGRHFESYANINLALNTFDKKKKYILDLTIDELLFKKAEYAHFCNFYDESKDILNKLLTKTNGELKKKVLLKLMSMKDKGESHKRNDHDLVDVHKTGLVSYALKHGGSIHSLPLINFFPDTKTITNPSVSIVKNKIMVSARYINYLLCYSNRCPNEYGPVSYLLPEDTNSIKSENVIYEFYDNMDIKSIKPVNMSLNKEPNWHYIGLEDARLMEWNKELYLCGVRRDFLGEGKGRLELTKVKEKKESFEEIERLSMPAPGPDDSYCEKNWMGIIDEPFKFVKWTNPTEVVEFNPETKETKTIVLDESKRYEFTRDPRGGSQVLKWNEDFYIAITHESFYNENDNGRKYLQRIIVWDKDWNVVNWTQDFTMMLGQIEFVSGMCFYKDSVLISFGYEDNAGYVLKMPKKAFDAFVIGG